MLNFASIDPDPGKTLGYWGGLGRRRPFHICKRWWGEFSVFEKWIQFLFLFWKKTQNFDRDVKVFMRIPNPGDESLSITTSPVVRPCWLDHIRSPMDALGWSQQVTTLVIIMRGMVRNSHHLRIDYKSDKKSWMLTRSSRDHSRCPWAISAGNNESDGESDYENDKNGVYLLDHIRSTLDALERTQQVNDFY